jgi:hypothetical protein
MSDSNVTQDQLKLLMQSHKDSIESNAKLLAKLDAVLDSQKDSCAGMNKLCDKIDQQTTTLTESNLKIHDKLTEIRIKSVEEHNSIKHRINVAFSIVGTIITGITGLAAIVIKALTP